MRLTQEQIEVIAYRVVHDLEKNGMLTVSDARDVEARMASVIADELRVEDDLNDEVREIMQAHDAEIRRADVELHDMFRAIKSRLARERNLII